MYFLEHGVTHFLFSIAIRTLVAEIPRECRGQQTPLKLGHPLCDLSSLLRSYLQHTKKSQNRRLRICFGFNCESLESAKRSSRAQRHHNVLNKLAELFDGRIIENIALCRRKESTFPISKEQASLPENTESFFFQLDALISNIILLVCDASIATQRVFTRELFSNYYTGFLCCWQLLCRLLRTVSMHCK